MIRREAWLNKVWDSRAEGTATATEPYEALERAQLVVLNIRAEAERPRAEELVADVGRLRRERPLFADILGSRGTRIPVTAVVANLADPEDRDRKKALTRVRRAIASRS